MILRKCLTRKFLISLFFQTIFPPCSTAELHAHLFSLFFHLGYSSRVLRTSSGLFSQLLNQSFSASRTFYLRYPPRRSIELGRLDNTIKESGSSYLCLCLEYRLFQDKSEGSLDVDARVWACWLNILGSFTSVLFFTKTKRARETYRLHIYILFEA